MTAINQERTNVHELDIHCLEVEQALLGTLLSFNQSWFDVADLLRSEHFFEDIHARLFEAIGSEIELTGRCSPLAIIAQFRADPVLNQLGGASACIARLIACADIPLAAKANARMIWEYAQRRRVREIAGELIDRAKYDPLAMQSDIVSEAVQAFAHDEFVSSRIKRTRYDASELGNEVVERVNAAYRDGKPSELHPWCGSADLHKCLGGWKRKRLYIIGGRPGMGKSTVAPSWLTRTALKGHGVLYLTLEMEAREVIERCLSDLAWSPEKPVPYERIGRDDLTAWEIEQLCEAQQRLNIAPLVVDEVAKPSLARLRTIVQQVAQRMAATGKRLEVVCIDHIGNMDPPDRFGDNKVAALEELSGGLKAMAKELDIALIGLSQLSRNSEHRDDKRPQLADLRFSGGIEQDADVVLLLFREAYYLERRRESEAEKEAEREARLLRVANDLEVVVAKNRGGACRTLRFFADMASSAVRDAA